CGVSAPAGYEGLDLGPAWRGEGLPERLILSETKWPIEGRMLKMAALGEWKLIGSLLDGRRELYHLPEEQKECRHAEPALATALGDSVRRWMDEEEFWIVYARGSGQFAVTCTGPGPFLACPIRIGRQAVPDRVSGSVP